MNRYRSADGKIWFEIYPGKLTRAQSIAEADQKKADGATGISKEEVRNWYGPLQEL